MEYFGLRPINSFFDQESIHAYKPGGFHPVCLDDTFEDGRYVIRHKLGWGGFATVWLARDTIKEEWVAIKILAARTDQEKASKEMSILRELSDQSTDANAYVVDLLDEFHIEGPNGRHHCLVLELLGPTLDYVINSCLYVEPDETRTSDDRIDSEVILRVSQQLLGTLVSLHDKGIVHGDISAHNIAFTAKNLRTASEDDLFEILGGAPKVEDLIREDGQPLDPRFPRHFVRQAGWSWVDENEEDIRLIDWGESFRRGQEPEELSQPVDIKAPEIIFAESFDYRVDLWSAGLVICHMLFGHRPFGTIRNDSKLIVPQMINFVEDLPDEWKDKWLKMKDELAGTDAAGTAERILLKARSLDVRFDDEVLEDPEEPPLRPLLPIIKGLMRFRPSDRLTASQALELLPPLPERYIEEPTLSMDETA